MLLSASVQAAAAIPAGIVTFADRDTIIGQATLKDGKASLTVTSFTQGQHVLTAAFAGDADFAASASAPVVLQVNAGISPPSITCSASPVSVMQGDPVQIVAAAGSASAKPLVYMFNAPSGVITGSGKTAVWQTATAIPGISSLLCTVEDESGRSSSAIVPVNVVSPAAGERAAAADAFVDAAGVNVHFGVLNTAYTTLTQTLISALQASGIRHVRDSLFDDDWVGSNTYYSVHNQLAVSGIRTDYITSIGQTAEQIQAYPLRVRDMEAIEAPNEQDNRNNPAWQKQLTAYLPVIEGAVHGSRPMPGITIVGPSFVNSSSFFVVGDISRWMDVSNLHNYFGGYNPGTEGWGPPDREGNLYGSIPWAMDEARVDGPSEPIWSTETGYQTIPNQQGSVSEAVGGMYAPRVLFEQWLAGIRRTYFYELADQAGTPMFGLLHQDGTPKPSYTAVACTLNLLRDPGPAFVPGSLDFQLSGQLKNVHHLLLQKRDNSFWLALWVELPDWNVNHPLETVPSAIQTVSLLLGDDAVTVDSASLNLDGTMSRTKANSSRFMTLPLSGRVSFVQIGMQLSH